MMRALRPRHLVTLVLALSAAAVLTPLTVAAVSTTAVTLYDSSGAHSARVTGGGALHVDAGGSGAGVLSGKGRVSSTGHAASLLTLTTSGETVGISQLSLTGPKFPASSIRVTLDLWTRVSGSLTCAAVASQVTSAKATPTGFGLTHIRDYMLSSGPYEGGPLLVTFPIAGLPVGPTATAYACLGVRMVSGSDPITADLTGYRIS